MLQYWLKAQLLYAPVLTESTITVSSNTDWKHNYCILQYWLKAQLLYAPILTESTITVSSSTDCYKKWTHNN